MSARWCVIHLQLSCSLHVRLIAKSAGMGIYAFKKVLITHKQSIVILAACKLLNIGSYLQILHLYLSATSATTMDLCEGPLEKVKTLLPSWCKGQMKTSQLTISAFTDP